MSTTDETEELRGELRKLFTGSGTLATLHQRATDTESAAAVAGAVERDLEQIGAAVLEIPEEFDGAGGGTAEVLVALEEAARGLLAPDLLGTAGLAVPALLAVAGGDADSQAGRALTEVSTGDTWVAVWPGVNAPLQAPALEATAVSGRVSVVPGADSAERILLVLPDGDGVVVAEPESAARVPVNALDLTRGAAALDFAETPVKVLGRLGRADAELLRARWSLAFAAECLGGALALQDTSVAYASERRAFGRQIGSFQAVRHRCSNMFVQTETLRASLLIAAAEVAAGSDGALDEALTTLSHALEVYPAIGLAATLLHGGIGFTFEADVHFHVRRADTLVAVAGPVDRLRDELVTRYTA